MVNDTDSSLVVKSKCGGAWFGHMVCGSIYTRCAEQVDLHRQKQISDCPGLGVGCEGTG